MYYLYEAAVGGGIPLISTLHGSFGANGIRRIAGILNGTTNYILTRLRVDGMSFDDRCASRKQGAMPKKDPSADVDGLDTARKICILASIVSGRSVRLRDCRAIEGIRGICRHTEAAALLGYSLKLLGVYENGETYTTPCLVPFESLLSATEDVFNAVSITGTAVGEVVLYGRGAARFRRLRPSSPTSSRPSTAPVRPCSAPSRTSRTRRLRRRAGLSMRTSSPMQFPAAPCARAAVAAALSSARTPTRASGAVCRATVNTACSTRWTRPKTRESKNMFYYQKPPT